MEAACSSETLVYYTVSQPWSQNLNSLVLPAWEIRKVQGLYSENNCLSESFVRSRQLLKNLPTHHGSQRFITVFIRSLQLSLPGPDESSITTTSYFSGMHFNIIPYLRPGVLFPSCLEKNGLPVGSTWRAVSGTSALTIAGSRDEAWLFVSTEMSLTDNIGTMHSLLSPSREGLNLLPPYDGDLHRRSKKHLFHVRSYFPFRHHRLNETIALITRARKPESL
jgi:hypothetical protein